ncbi:MAG: 50S ribosomal protein L24 [Sphingobium sp.]|nr:MAG: 50S ribosomal protein L24 [Sphingobium sp.]
MSAAKIKKGDKVVVLAGKDKGRTGAVLQVMPKDDKVLVEGINVHAKHRKPDHKDGKPTRVRFEDRDGKKVRVAVKSGEVL